VEHAISAYSGVLEWAVVAIPDEKWGERPKAFVTFMPDAHATEPEIIVFGPLPKTSTGKVQKNVLRARERTGRTSGIN
jgi:fatty-acyl-CoA synthase